MIVKVCGMRDEQNIAQVAALGVDMMGFIFYPKSPRFVDKRVDVEGVNLSKVGVFVNESVETILSTAAKFSLEYIQLHGSESREQCQLLREKGFKVIKCVSISSVADMPVALHYLTYVDMLLFDTKCSSYGGSGESFNWKILDSYCGNTPFLVSGGISPEMAEQVRALSHPMFAGVDLNSRFELEPALKNVEELAKFINEIRK